MWLCIIIVYVDSCLIRLSSHDTKFSALLLESLAWVMPGMLFVWHRLNWTTRQNMLMFLLYCAQIKWHKKSTNLHLHSKGSGRLAFCFCVCLCRKLCMSLLQVGLAYFCLIMALHGCGISSSATWMHWCHAVVPKFRFGVITDDVEITHLLEPFQSSIWTLFCLNAFKLTFLVLESACCHNKACSCCIFLQL